MRKYQDFAGKTTKFTKKLSIFLLHTMATKSHDSQQCTAHE